MRTTFKLLWLSLVFGFAISSCKKPNDLIAPPVSITLNKTSVNLAKDDFYISQLTATIQNPNIGDTLIIWKSENPRIASVTDKGMVYPQGAGTTNVIATLANGRATAKCVVTITDGYDYKYRIVLKDKGTSNFSVSNPSAFLSAKAIARRQQKNIAVDESDLPISPIYLKQIQDIGGVIIAKSKWLSTVTVHTNNQFLIDKYEALPFVKEVVLVWMDRRTTVTKQYVDVPQVGNNKITSVIDYGTALSNITPNNGTALHEKGFKGLGIDIAVIDAGFIGMKQNAMFNNINIKVAKSFVYENDDPYATGTHGVWVTSCMAISKPGNYVGTAPEANYWLLRTEDEATENPIEEDYWASAIEFADSVGVDIVNSSLSYKDFYIQSLTYKFNDMDGKTAFSTRAANKAFEKGILIVNCAGNDRSWVGAPADSPNVLTVGSVNSNLEIDNFTSWGITVDGRMKPDVLARGGSARVANVSATTEFRSGTSYASPILCGLAACLWQAYPKLTNKEIIEVIRKAGNRSSNPIVPYGNGIPDFQKAMDLAKVLAKQ